MTETCLTDVDQFLNVVEQSGLLEPKQLESWRKRSDKARDARGLATQMVRENVLTRYQGNRLLEGKYNGFIIGTYKVMELLLEGKKDAVFLAWHATMDRHVALKIIKQNQSDCKLTKQRFMREAQITASLDHPHIVKLFDSIEQNGLQYLVMEYVEGTTLQQLLNKNGTIPVQHAVEYIRQAALGLQYAHDCGIVHRDLKPSNFILNNKGMVKILDMGHSRISDNEQMNITELYNPASVVGTVDYIAPELALGQEYTVCCDIYSLGASLFSLIAGHPPFQGTSYQILMAHQLEEIPDLTQLQNGVSVRLQKLIAKMMAKQPVDRPQSVQEVIDAITAMQANRTSLKVPKLPPVTELSQSATVKSMNASKARQPVATSSKPGLASLNASMENSRSAKHVSDPKLKELIRKASDTGLRPQEKSKPRKKKAKLNQGMVIAAACLALAGIGALLIWIMK